VEPLAVGEKNQNVTFSVCGFAAGVSGAALRRGGRVMQRRLQRRGSAADGEIGDVMPLKGLESGLDPFYELSTICVRNVRDAFWGLDRESASIRELQAQPGAALTISWNGPSIASLKTMNAPELLNDFNADDVLKQLSLKLQSGSFPSHPGRLVGSLPNGGFVSLHRSPNRPGVQQPICFFISKPCFISSNEFGIALISVPHDSITSLLPPDACIAPLSFCIIARRVSGRLEFNVCAELGVASYDDQQTKLDELHQSYLPLSLLLKHLQEDCSASASFAQEIARAKLKHARRINQIIPAVLQIVLPYLPVPSHMNLLAVCKQCRKLTLDYCRDASTCDASSALVAPSRLNHLLQMHERLTSLTLNVAKNSYSFHHILLCTPTLVNLTALRLHNLRAMADADVAHVLRACKQLRIAELTDAIHVGALSLVALASSCRHLLRLKISASHSSIVTDLLARELATTCFSSPLQALEFPMCFRYNLTAIRQIVTNFGGALLSVLDLSGCLQLGDAGICSIVTLCGRLETFIAKFSPASDASCHALSKCSNLASLDLSGSLPTRKGLVALTPLAPSLRRLSLSKCTVVNDSNLCELLRLLPIIEYIDIRGCPSVSYSTILLLAKLAPHAAIKHSVDHGVALATAVEVVAFIQPISDRNDRGFPPK
jgi:hypothetical protein